MENESKVNEHEFDDIVEVIQEDRKNAAPRYASLPESIFGEINRMSEKKREQMEKGGGLNGAGLHERKPIRAANIL